jgi:hypothetical protein
MKYIIRIITLPVFILLALIVLVLYIVSYVIDGPDANVDIF